MLAKDLEHSSYVVPLGMGHLLGNTLRQFAMRGTHSWQVAAYKVGTREGSYGFSGGLCFSCLDLLEGSLVCSDVGVAGGEKSCKFELSDGRFVANGTEGPMYIENLGNLGINSMQVCLVCASGSRTAEQNYEVAKRVFGPDDSDYYAVPSRHTAAVAFSYKVVPRDFKTEELSIDATPGVVQTALESARRALGDLASATHEGEKVVQTH